MFDDRPALDMHIMYCRTCTQLELARIASLGPKRKPTGTYRRRSTSARSARGSTTTASTARSTPEPSTTTTATTATTSVANNATTSTGLASSQLPQSLSSTNATTSTTIGETQLSSSSTSSPTSSEQLRQRLSVPTLANISSLTTFGKSKANALQSTAVKQESSGEAVRDAAAADDDWVQCADCKKWRKVWSYAVPFVRKLPPDALWRCGDNFWDLARSRCGARQQSFAADAANGPPKSQLHA
jgi:hypothetical protein